MELPVHPDGLVWLRIMTRKPPSPDTDNAPINLHNPEHNIGYHANPHTISQLKRSSKLQGVWPSEQIFCYIPSQTTSASDILIWPPQNRALNCPSRQNTTTARETRKDLGCPGNWSQLEPNSTLIRLDRLRCKFVILLSR